MRAAFANLNIWKAGEKRAPNKPLLVLWAIGRCLGGMDRWTSYKVVDTELRILLRRFGPPRKIVHTEFPFWRLQHDDVWEVREASHISIGPGGDARIGSLIEENAHGGFPKEIYDDLMDDEQLAVGIAYDLVDAHFPSTLHADILKAVGIHSRFECVRRRPRDSLFRAKVLDAYDHRCAVCTFALRLNKEPIGLEAAHIKWHMARGPDQIANALSLCALHHRLFDAGAFTLSLDRRVVVSNAADGPSLIDVLGHFESREMFLPKSEKNFPDEQFLKWHHSEVFKSFADVN